MTARRAGSGNSGPGRVLILTAGMGAGHDRVASELRRRLARRGIEAEMVDVWDLVPFRLGRLIALAYKAIIHRVPWIYEVVYAIWLRPGSASARRASPIVGVAGRRLERWMAVHRPAVAVSTFHLCSQVLGDLRRRGRLPVPTASIVVDFAAHGLWVDPDVDVHFCLQPSQAERLRRLGARQTVVCGPVVSPAFNRDADRRALRAQLGLSDGERVILVVAGSWGAGHVERAVRAVGGDPRFRAVAVTGRNNGLRRRLDRLGSARVFGWVDDISGLVLAADAVVENAGGLMAMEAMAAGIPVVSFAPIPGHGRENVARMHEAGVSVYARSEAELLAVLDRLGTDEPYRQRLTGAARALFRSDLAEHVAAMVRSAEAAGEGVASD